MAVGTGFTQLFRGIGTWRALRRYIWGILTFIPFSGQVGGVGIASAIFQSTLDRELRRRIQGPDSEQV